MNPYFALANEEGRIKKTYAPPLSPSRSLCMNNNGYIFNQSKKLLRELETLPEIFELWTETVQNLAKYIGGSIARVVPFAIIDPIAYMVPHILIDIKITDTIAD